MHSKFKKAYILLMIIAIGSISTDLLASTYKSSSYTLIGARVVNTSGKGSSSNYILDSVEIGNIFNGKAESANYTLSTGSSIKATAPNPPVLEPVATPVNIAYQSLSGTKDTNTAIYINGNEVVPLNADTSWNYNITLVEGENSFSIIARNTYGLDSEARCVNICLDTTPPSVVAVVDSGDNTTDNTKLSASWTSSQDTGNGIGEYMYAVGTSIGASDVVNWKSAGSGNNITCTGLSLEHGPSYYISVYAMDKAGNCSNISSSDGITYGHPPQLTDITITSTGNLHQGWPVTIQAAAKDVDGDTIEYKYLADGKVIQGWTASSQAAWSPETGDIGQRTIGVKVRAVNETGNSKQKQAYLFRRPVSSE